MGWRGSGGIVHKERHEELGVGQSKPLASHASVYDTPEDDEVGLSDVEAEEGVDLGFDWGCLNVGEEVGHGQQQLGGQK